jgi:hypothetical protein
LYRALIDADQAASVASWRRMSVGQVAEIMTVEHDVISGIIISTSAKRLVEDPNEPLEF